MKTREDILEVDRLNLNISYNLGVLFNQGVLTKEEIFKILDIIYIKQGIWIENNFSKKEIKNYKFYKTIINKGRTIFPQ